MERIEAAGICAEVFSGWTRKLSENSATPLLALGVAHGPRSGELHLCTRDDSTLSRDVLRAFLMRAIELL